MMKSRWAIGFLVTLFFISTFAMAGGKTKSLTKEKVMSASNEESMTLGDVKDDIYRLSLQIRDVLPYSRATPQEMEDARRLLEDAYRILYEGGQNPGEDFRKCVDFAYEKYYLSLPSSDAMNRASSVCKTVGDLDSLKFLFDAHYLSLTAVNAMDKAASEATRYLRDKVMILKFAYDAYYLQLTSTNAASKAAFGTSQVSKDSLACLRTAFERHYQSLPAAQAMDQAFSNCR